MFVHQELVLNAELSVTSRLLYVVLQARVDDGSSLGEVAPLVGLENAEQVRPFLDELVEAGVVETRPHLGRAPQIVLHQTPLTQEERTDRCVPCGRCGECSCDHTKGLCRICDEIERVEKAAQQDLDRWMRQRDAGATYAIGRSSARLHAGTAQA
ncbi:hypothetical protein ACPZ13_00340 [Streptomyces sp. IPPR8]|uniref:hypothetical protein n=1 Tax=Streptomyces sp. IPPR8 TaxID=3417301 RepID=UPI003D692C3C